jgi:hypothetical protein
MSAGKGHSLDIEKAQRVWDEYQKQHDVSAHLGQAVGIDPDTGEVFFGDSIRDVVERLDAQGAFRPLFYLRVGQRYYWRKGRRA